MPMAFCWVNKSCQVKAGDLIDMWAAESGESSQHMTVNLLNVDEQLGNAFAVMANLMLPSLWQHEAIRRLQVGLAKALAQYYGLDLQDVFVITQVIESGNVVENGKPITW